MDIKKKTIYLSVFDFSRPKMIDDYREAKKIIKNHRENPVSMLFFQGKRSDVFFTEDSKLYITPREAELMKSGIGLNRELRNWDGLSSRIISSYRVYRPKESDFLYKKLSEKYEQIDEVVADGLRGVVEKFTLIRLWNFSMVGAILLGMVTMSFIYRYLGQGASAGSSLGERVEVARVLGEQTENDEVKEIRVEDVEYMEKIIKDMEDLKKEEFEKEIMKMVQGYPIEKMVPYIAEKDRIVAAFLVGIAKKESNWGKRVPVLDGQDCYNYWGYRGKRKLMGTGGHTCFNSRKDAVDTVSERLEWLIKNEKLNTPEKMIIWKCGFSCAGHSDYSVQKWISDVDMYFQKLNK